MVFLFKSTFEVHSKRIRAEKYLHRIRKMMETGAQRLMAIKKNNKTKQIAKQPEIVEKLDRWIFYGFLVILVMIPLAFARIFPYNTHMTFDQFDIQKVLTLRILTTVIFGLWVWKMLIARTKEIR